MGPIGVKERVAALLSHFVTSLDDRFHETGVDETGIDGTGSMLVDSSFEKS
jgi:hypothetical protein